MTMTFRAYGLFFGLVSASTTHALAFEPIRPGPQQAAKPCPRHGSGFVRIPGSDTCIRIGGRARTGLDLRARDDGPASRPIVGGRLAVDTRVDTDYGPVRTYVRIDAGRR
ncbi:porin [Methylobacterium sp. E-045]|uniref:porin n=1 Tax=Methylobacterium sp. E-045 TaxID=2836575 RepID=UPI0028BD90C5|nr:porin [Methylobacterium sp. E-045]